MTSIVFLIKSLIRNREVLLNLLAGASKNAALWKPDSTQWCMLEVLCHLIDEEKDDFRERLKKTLENPEIPFMPIDPLAWVKERNYMGQDFDKKIKEFLHERDKSIYWLQSLSTPNWKNSTLHPTAGVMTAEKLFVNWVAHDYHHIRQLVRLKYGYLKKRSGLDLTYAGDW